MHFLEGREKEADLRSGIDAKGWWQLDIRDSQQFGFATASVLFAPHLKKSYIIIYLCGRHVDVALRWRYSVHRSFNALATNLGRVGARKQIVISIRWKFIATNFNPRVIFPSARNLSSNFSFYPTRKRRPRIISPRERPRAKI